MRFKSLLVALAIVVATLLTWEVGAAIQRHSNGQPPPSQSASTVIP